MASKKKTLVLLDSHAVLHRAFHAIPGFTSPKGEPTGAIYGFTSTLLKTIRDFNPDYLVACFDLPEPTFRHQVYDKYKAKRPQMASELSFQIEGAKKLAKLFGIPTYEKAGFEADDVLATIVEQVKNENVEVIIVTGDLDTIQLVSPKVRVYTMKRGITDSVMYDEKAVKERYGFAPVLLPDFKGLMGDPSDNIIGVVGIGEKTAKDLISNFGSLKGLYKKLEKDENSFEKKGIKPRIINLLKENKEEALFSRELAETRRDVPVEFDLEESKWPTGFDEAKIKDFFQDLGLKSFLNKLPFFVQEGVSKDKDEIPLADSEKTDDQTEAEIKLAFWMLDSRKTKVELKDILVETRIFSPKKAQEFLEEKIRKTDFSELYFDTELPLVNIFKRMEQKGILLDVDYLKKLSKDYHQKLDILENKIWEMAGMEFNINSPKQLAEVLFEKMGISPKGMRKTGQGAISTRFSELEKIEDDHEIIKEIFSYRELAKLTSTYIDNLPEMVDSNSRLHGSFNQTGTTTGRISSSDPNLQNIPTRTEFGQAVRKAFVVSKGWNLVSFDYSQIDLRVMASLSGDKKLQEAFKDGVDIHSSVASEVFNVPSDKVDSEMRRKAKIINFGIIYGMGINSLKKQLGCSKDEAISFFGEYFRDFPGVAAFTGKNKEETRKAGYARTLFGRRRYLPEINSPIEYIRKEAERMAVNAPIQGTSADIIKIALVQIDKILSEKGFSKSVYPILQVHDELIFEIKEDVLDEAILLIKKIMEENKLPDVSLKVGVSFGYNWSELK
ncbi:DNA polymerase [Patescibacteria group bacterium]